MVYEIMALNGAYNNGHEGTKQKCAEVHISNLGTIEHRGLAAEGPHGKSTQVAMAPRYWYDYTLPKVCSNFFEL